MVKRIMKSIVKHLILMTFVLALINKAFAEEIDDQDMYTGPGVGLAQSSYDFGGSIYNATSNGIEGSYVSEANAISGVAPTYVENTVEVPINNYGIDMGPTSGYQFAEYSLHFINDGGPGMNVTTNELGTPMYYDNVGPGIGLQIITNDGSPTVYESTANPENWLQIRDLGPTSGEAAISRKKKDE